MNTAQLVITRGNQTQIVKSVVPWVVGAAVVIFALWVIKKL